MKENVIIIVISLIISWRPLCAQEKLPDRASILGCDTANYPFLKTYDQNAKSISQKSKTVIFIYEGSAYYSPAYAYIFWKTKNIFNNKFIINDLSSNPSIKKLKNPLLEKIEIDSLEKILINIINLGTDTTSSISHNHLLYFHFFCKGKSFSYKICEDQMIMYPEQDKINYLKEIIYSLRKENGK